MAAGLAATGLANAPARDGHSIPRPLGRGCTRWTPAAGAPSRHSPPGNDDRAHLPGPMGVPTGGNTAASTLGLVHDSGDTSATRTHASRAGCRTLVTAA
ncbi:hypothetical protein OH686_03780 [Pseudomonas sp. SO81]|nr:hypothetical protein OH686_03780 [Pseudomonas sp. SO81]